MQLRRETVRSVVLWILLTLPLAMAAFIVYVASEWLFFVTKTSSLTFLPLKERLVVALETPTPFVAPLFLVQACFTVLSLVAFPRLRAAAAVPAGMVVACMILILIDNFTYVIVGFSSLHVPRPHVYYYAALVPVLVVLSSRWLWRHLARLDRRATFRVAAVLWLLSLPSLVLFVTGARNRFIRVLSDLPGVAARASASARQLPNILILTADGVDAQRLSAYGYQKPTSPMLEALRNETLFCENAFSNAGRTQGSLISMLTGKLPTRTRVFFPPTALSGDARFEHLPGILKQQGYRTLQLTMRHYSDAEDANLLNGFDLSNYRWQQVVRFEQGNAAADSARRFRNEVVERVSDRLLHIFSLTEARDDFAHVMGLRKSPFWSDGRRISTLLQFIETTDSPWFVQLHLTDMHEGGWPRDNPQGYGIPSDAYDAALREADDSLRLVVEALREQGLLDRTVIVTGSDHGRYWETRQRVPLAFRFPRGEHRRIERGNTQLLDVAPTLLDYLDLPIPRWMDGRSLIAPQPLPARPIFSLNGIGKQHYLGHDINVVADPRPPNYGVRTAVVILGSQWHELDLETGVLTSGPVPGHTARQASDPALARRLLVDHLASAGFVVGRKKPILKARSGPVTSAPPVAH